MLLRVLLVLLVSPIDAKVMKSTVIKPHMSMDDHIEAGHAMGLSAAGRHRQPRHHVPPLTPLGAVLVVMVLLVLVMMIKSTVVKPHTSVFGHTEAAHAIGLSSPDLRHQPYH